MTGSCSTKSGVLNCVQATIPTTLPSTSNTTQIASNSPITFKHVKATDLTHATNEHTFYSKTAPKLIKFADAQNSNSTSTVQLCSTNSTPNTFSLFVEKLRLTGHTENTNISIPSNLSTLITFYDISSSPLDLSISYSSTNNIEEEEVKLCVLLSDRTFLTINLSTKTLLPNSHSSSALKLRYNSIDCPINDLHQTTDEATNEENDNDYHDDSSSPPTLSTIINHNQI